MMLNVCVYIYIYYYYIATHNISESNKKYTLIYIHIYDILNSIYKYFLSFVLPRFLFFACELCIIINYY